MDISAAQQISSALSQTGSTKAGDGLGKDSFLQLLITQMRYQDPLEPSSDTEYIAQLAQFNALEQMQNLNDKVDKLLKASQVAQSSSLIGKQVDGLSANQTVGQDGKPSQAKVSGTVSEVRYIDGTPLLVVGNEEIKLSDIVRVY
jgi:flagellar basal-body rod modification protein FlgD